MRLNPSTNHFSKVKAYKKESLAGVPVSDPRFLKSNEFTTVAESKPYFQQSRVINSNGQGNTLYFDPAKAGEDWNDDRVMIDLFKLKGNRMYEIERY